MPSRLGALGDDDVGSGFGMFDRVRCRAGECGDLDVGCAGSVDHVCGGRAECRRDEFDGVRERNVDQRLIAGRRHVHAHAPRALAVGEIGNTEAPQDVVDERLMRGREQLAQFISIETAFCCADVFLWKQEIDAVGTDSDLGVDPRKIDLELFRAVRNRSEHTEAAGTRHSGHDVSTVTEGEDREFAPE